MKKYKLIKEETQHAIAQCDGILWAEWDEWENNFDSVNKIPGVGKSLMINHYISSIILEITETTEDHINFKTKDGNYKLIINHGKHH